MGTIWGERICPDAEETWPPTPDPQVLQGPCSLTQAPTLLLGRRHRFPSTRPVLRLNGCAAPARPAPGPPWPSQLGSSQPLPRSVPLFSGQEEAEAPGSSALVSSSDEWVQPWAPLGTGLGGTLWGPGEDAQPGGRWQDREEDVGALG